MFPNLNLTMILAEAPDGRRPPQHVQHGALRGPGRDARRAAAQVGHALLRPPRGRRQEQGGPQEEEAEVHSERGSESDAASATLLQGR